jgi:hypothetical protein
MERDIPGKPQPADVYSILKEAMPPEGDRRKTASSPTMIHLHFHAPVTIQRFYNSTPEKS